MTETEARTKWRKGRPKTGMWEKTYPLAERIADLSIPVTESGCIVWAGALNDNGYGRIKVRGVFRRVHRIAWELVNGMISDGLVIDHLCRVRCCVNPAHMEVVTRGENTRRSNLFRYRGKS